MSEQSIATEPNKGTRIWSVGTLKYTTGGLVVLFLWLLWGDFAWSMKDRVIPPVVQLVLKKFEISDFLSGVLMGAVPPFLGLVLGPVISCWSDRTRSKWGRRIPFLLIPTPFIVLSIVALAFSPQVGTWLHRVCGGAPQNLNAYIIAVFAVFWIFFDVSTMVANSVFGGLVNDIVPRQVIGRFYGLFRAISLIAGIIFNYALMGSANEHFGIIFLGVGALYGFGVTAMCFKVKEGDYPPPDNHESGRHPLLAVKNYFYECFSSPYYLGIFLLGTLQAMGTNCINLFSIYAAGSFNVSMAHYGFCLAITYICSLVLAYPLGALVDRSHPLPLGIITMILYAVTMGFSYFWVHDTLSFEIALIVHGVLAGTYGTITSGMAALLFPRAKFSQYCSAGGIIGSLAGMALGPLLGLLLDFSNHNYRYTFAGGAIFTILSLAIAVPVYFRFLKLGGRQNYVAPEPQGN